MKLLLPSLILLVLINAPIQDAHADGVLIDPQSNMAHSSDCSHLARGIQHIEISSLAEAEQLGYRICPICFGAPPSVDGYEAERLLGTETAAKVRYYYAPCHNDSIQALVREAGRRVLGDWPYNLVGYRYSFTVVESDLINAVACPTGFIFVTTGLLNCIEYPGELDFILAHEIAHVEERHGLAQLRNAEGMGIIGTFLAAMAGAATESPEIATVAAAMSEVASAIVLSGYSKQYENYADLMGAKAYDAMHNSRDHATLFLRKAKDIIPSARSGMFSSHPDIDLRAHRVSTAEFSGGQAKFVGDKLQVTVYDIAVIPARDDDSGYEGEIYMMTDVSGDLPGWVSAQRSATIGVYLGDQSLSVADIDRLTEDYYKLRVSAESQIDLEQADRFVIATKATGVRRRIELLRR